jgi:type IV pilus assembly protein PilW
MKGERCFLENKKMKRTNRFNIKGITLIELLMALVIFGILTAGIYRVFIVQSKAYMVQDQVVEIQQSVRSAMGILLRDVRMAGFDDDNRASTISITDPIASPINDHTITVNYEEYDRTISQFQKHTVAYWRDAESSRLMRQLTINDMASPQETLLESVDELNFVYGVDVNDDGAIDQWVSAEKVKGSKVVAVRVTLIARPVQSNTDLRVISPRTLVSVATLRNVCLGK